jgi:hypothetical protein
MFVAWKRMIPDSSGAEQRRSIVGEHGYRATPSPASPLMPGKLSYIFLGRPQLSFSRRFSRQSKAALTAAVPQIRSHRQTISIGANCISPAIFFCARRHRRRIQFSRQLFQDFREYFFRISLHRTSRVRPLQGWFTPLRRLAMLLQGSISYSCDRTLSALITASLTPSVIRARPSHPVGYASCEASARWNR